MTRHPDSSVVATTLLHPPSANSHSCLRTVGPEDLDLDAPTPGVSSHCRFALFFPIMASTIEGLPDLNPKPLYVRIRR